MKSHYRWVIVAAGGFMGCVAIGSIFSLPVFLQPMMDDTGWSRASISLAMTLDFITMGVASFAWGVAMDRYGPRVVSLAGSILLGLGLVLASRASSVLEFQLLYGIVVGAGGGRFLRQIWPR
jgi:sugar phosphate permease